MAAVDGVRRAGRREQARRQRPERCAVTISDKHRKLFEGIGFEDIRRRVTLGNNYYLPIDQAAQAEAREWVAEQEEKNREAERDRINRETLTLKYTRWTLIAAIAAVVVGVVGIVVVVVRSGTGSKLPGFTTMDRRRNIAALATLSATRRNSPVAYVYFALGAAHTRYLYDEG